MGIREEQALAEAAPGRLIDDIRTRASGVIRRGLREAVLPPASPLRESGNRLFVVTNPNNVEDPVDLTVGLLNIHDGTAKLGLDFRGVGVDEDVPLIRKALDKSMAVGGVETAEVDLTDSLVPVEVLKDVGFKAVKGGQVLEYTGFYSSAHPTATTEVPQAA